MDEGQKHLTYLRVGVGLKELDKITAVLELWPVGHSSPKHHHGGCAGSVHVLSGVLDVKLYDSIISETPMSWKNGDAGLKLGPGAHQSLQLAEGDTTWMNRANWYVHEVAAIARPGNGFGFAMSLHVYKSCKTEFGMVKGGVLKLASPENDFFWNINLEKDDPRLHEGIPSFMHSLVSQPAPAMPAMKQPAPAQQPEPMKEDMEAFTGTAGTTDNDLRGMSPRRSVQLAGCMQVTDAGVEHVACKCAAELREIDLSGCVQLTDEAVKHIYLRCGTQLQSINASDTQITDGAVETMVDWCRHLRQIKLAGCKRISDQAVRFRTDTCKLLDLESLDLSGCTQLTDEVT
eukprot:3823553-Amphidinium_carterae.1